MCFYSSHFNIALTFIRKIIYELDLKWISFLYNKLKGSSNKQDVKKIISNENRRTKIKRNILKRPVIRFKHFKSSNKFYIF